MPTPVAAFGKGAILRHPFRKTRRHIVTLTLERMWRLFYLKRANVSILGGWGRRPVTHSCQFLRHHRQHEQVITRTGRLPLWCQRHQSPARTVDWGQGEREPEQRRTASLDGQRLLQLQRTRAWWKWAESKKPMICTDGELKWHFSPFAWNVFFWNFWKTKQTCWMLSSWLWKKIRISIHPLSTTYPKSGRGGSIFSSEPQTSLSPATPANSDWGIPRRSLDREEI